MAVEVQKLTRGYEKTGIRGWLTWKTRITGTPQVIYANDPGGFGREVSLNWLLGESMNSMGVGRVHIHHKGTNVHVCPNMGGMTINDQEDDGSEKHYSYEELVRRGSVDLRVTKTDIWVGDNGIRLRHIPEKPSNS